MIHTELMKFMRIEIRDQMKISISLLSIIQKMKMEVNSKIKLKMPNLHLMLLFRIIRKEKKTRYIKLSQNRVREYLKVVLRKKN